MKENSDKRRTIMETACRLFSRRGFFQTSMRDIAREANVAVGTTYIYFPTKEELLNAIYQLSSTRLLERINARLESLAGAQQKLEAFLQESIGFSLAHPDDFLILFVDLRRSELEFPQRAVFRNFRRYVDVLRAILDDGYSRGAFRQPASSQLLMGIMGFWVAIVLRAVIDPAVRDLEKQQRDTLAVVMTALEHGLVGVANVQE